MRRLNRSAVPTPPSLAKAGAEERTRAEAHYLKDPEKQEAFKYSAYKGGDVVEALNLLTHEKCAYCESRYRATAPVDIEHYRPKGAILIDGQRQKPGYYWLAAEWTNLLPACIDCNRARTQEFPDDDITEEVRGKENKFPLRDETHRGRRPGEEITLERGQRLLLDPCRDDPSAHLDFTPNGLVRARKRGGKRSRKGGESIKVLALRRKGLKEERRERLYELALKMDDILYFVRRLDAELGDVDARDQFAKRMTRLRKAADPSAPYSEMSRQFIEQFEKSLRERTCPRFVHDLLESVSAGALRPDV
jgi:uncharacterized protein (TIGR02646 family)